MATPLTAAQMLDALTREGLKIIEYRNWRGHNRNSKGPWGSVHGVMIHHTVTRGSTPEQTAGSVQLCYAGHRDLPGPLCHAVGAKDGKVYLVGHGRANHAGKGDGDVLADVVSEMAPPFPRPNESNTDGNRSFYGIELINLGNGVDPWPAAQYEAAVKYAAAICRAHGWSERSVIGHKEWQPGKIDPTFDMAKFRAAVAVRLKPVPPPVVKPPPAPPKETRTMRYTSLAKTTSETIAPGTAEILYLDAEYQDGAGDHGTGGKTIISGEHYTGTISFQFADALPPGVQARLVHELDAGGRSNEPNHHFTSGVVEQSFSVTGRVPEDRNLVLEIENDSTESVVLEWAGVRLFTEAL